MDPKTPKLILDNPELLFYLDGSLHLRILGGIKLSEATAIK
jgi:hypothetical protein